MNKIVIDGHLYTNHPTLRWLRLGSWGWQSVPCPF